MEYRGTTTNHCCMYSSSLSSFYRSDGTPSVACLIHLCFYFRPTKLLLHQSPCLLLNFFLSSHLCFCNKKTGDSGVRRNELFKMFIQNMPKISAYKSFNFSFLPNCFCFRDTFKMKRIQVFDILISVALCVCVFPHIVVNINLDRSRR